MKFPDTKSIGSAGSKNYFTLKDGESKHVIFAGDPSLFRAHWVSGKTIICGMPNDCAQCDLGNKSSFRFKINVIVKENEAYIAKIWERGITEYEVIKDLNRDYNPKNENIMPYVMKITRKGSTKDDTNYSIIPRPNGRVQNEMATKLKDVKLHNFGSETSSFNDKPDVESWTPPTDSDFVPEKMEEIPF